MWRRQCARGRRGADLWPPVSEYGCSVRARRRRAQAPALLWIHGGGYVIGRAAQDDVLCRRYASELGATVASVDYRLAPEHPYPAPVEDCYSALSGCPAAVGRSGTRGDRWRQRGRRACRCAGPAHPGPRRNQPGRTAIGVSDARRPHRRTQRSGQPRATGCGTSPATSSAGCAYLGGADPEVAVPARREDLAGCRPRGWVSARWTCSTTRTWPTPSDSRPQACPARSRSSPGAFHGFDGIAPKADVSQSFFTEPVRAAATGVHSRRGLGFGQSASNRTGHHAVRARAVSPGTSPPSPA